MPAGTLNDFLAGFFYGQIVADLEVKMANTRQDDRRKGVRRETSRRKGDITTIEVEGKEDKEQKVAVRHEIAPQTKEKSTWSWHEEFAVEWSETLIARKKKKHPGKGE
jgi:hypothetical protein